MWGFRHWRWVVATLLSLLALNTACGQSSFPTIIVNNDTGSNPPAASGAPAAFGPVIPPNQCATSGSSTTINSASHGLGAVPTDGTAALWMDTASGRRWTRIVGVPTADTITVDNTFNIGTAVDCVVGGEIAGPPGTITSLCDDLKFGWTLEIENTGVDYADSGTCNVAARSFSGSASDGAIVIRGDDPDNRTVLLWGTNADYFVATEAYGPKFENLEIVKNAAGTTGEAITTAGNTVVKNVLIRQAVGSWDRPFGRFVTNSKSVIISNILQGPFDIDCAERRDDFVAGNYFNDCGGPSEFQGMVVFNVFELAGGAFDSINMDRRLIFAYNTQVSGNQATIDISNVAAQASIVASNIAYESAAVSGDCFEVSLASGANLLGTSGAADTNPNILWLGNNPFDCTQGEYDAVLLATPQGSATDLNPGSGFDPLFEDEVNDNFFPLESLLIDVAALPGSTYPFQTPAEPVSTPTAGASQIGGSAGGASAYAY